MNIKTGYEVIENSSKRGSNVVKGVSETIGDVKFVTKIDELIKARGISQRDLSELTGIQLSYLSDFILGKTSTINKTHLLALMAVLRVDSITDIIEIQIPDNLKEVFEADRYEWIDTKMVPNRVRELALLATNLRMEK